MCPQFPGCQGPNEEMDGCIAGGGGLCHARTLWIAIEKMDEETNEWNFYTWSFIKD